MNGLKNNNKILLKNGFVGVIASAISILSTYIVRIVFSHYLGDELYGINSLFASIISALLILELGISTAMVIFMYKPVAENNKEKIKTILNLYKKLYSIFCIVIFVSALIIDLFLLKFFVKSNLLLIQIQFYFILYVISICGKYIWSYKRCLIFASNENMISSLFSVISDLVFMAIEIMSIVVLKNYIAYLIVFILHNLSANALCNIYINKKFPFVKEKNCLPVTSDEKKEIVRVIKPLFVQRISNQIQDSANTIILSFISKTVAIVGYFANYQLIMHAVQTIYNQIVMAVTSLIGSMYAAENDKTVIYKGYIRNRVIMSTISILFVILYSCLITPFIKLFFGEQYILSNVVVILTTLYLYLLLTNETNKSLQNALGLHYLDSKYMIFQALIGILTSFILGYYFGVNGILIGSIFTFLCFSNIIKGIIIYKKFFNVKGYKYILIIIVEFIVFILNYIVYNTVYNLFNIENIMIFIFSAVILLIIMAINILILVFIIKKRSKKGSI